MSQCLGCGVSGGGAHNACCTATSGGGWKERLFRQKYRFDMGVQFLTILNFALLVLSVSDKVRTVVALPSWMVMALSVPGALLGVWAFGWWLDRLRYGHAINTEIMRRNPVWDEQMAVLRRIEERVSPPSEIKINDKMYPLTPFTDFVAGSCDQPSHDVRPEAKR